MPSTHTAPAALAPGREGVASGEYPLIAAEKFEAALSRVSRVHERFSRELGSMAEALAQEAGLADDCASLASRLPEGIEAIGEAARDIERALAAVEAAIEAGRASLEDVVEDVRDEIAGLEERTAGMRDIADFGARVSEGAGRVAEIADENRLIAINASVSASKAGDRVRGFKVIAAEISRLSGAMAARVPEVIRASAQVASRMDQIMAGMDESIAGARRALGAIDEAFSRLAAIGGALREASSGAAAMLEESGALAEGGRAIDAALGSMRDAIALSRDGAAALSSQMGAQGSAIARLGERMPSVTGLARGIAAGGAAAGGGGTAEGPKILRMNEIGLDRYDPALTRMIREIHYTSFTCIRLLRYSSEKKIVPYLAETWFLHPDGRTWEFALRRDARFSDGSPIGTADVRFSFERLLNPALGSPYAQLFTVIEGAEEYRSGAEPSVRGIETPDALTLRIRLREPNNFFLSLLALGYSAVVKANPAYAYRPISKEELVSAGPFAPAPDPEPGVDRLVANPGFVNGRPFIDEIRIRRTDAPPIEELLAGRVDLAYNLTAASKRALESGGFEGGFRPYTSRYCYGLVVNFARSSALARSPELRLALAMGLDKEGIIREALGGAGLRADCVIPSSLVDSGGEPFVPYDPEGARARIAAALRASAGRAAAPIKIAIREYPTIAGLERLGPAIQSNLERLGLSATVDYHPLSKPIGSYREAYDLTFIGFLPEIDLYSAVEPFINPEGGDNYFGYANEALFKELDATRGVKDEGERRARFSRILKTLTEDCFMVPIFFQQVYCAFRRGIRGVYVAAEETVMPELLFMEPEPAAGAAGPRDRQGDGPRGPEAVLGAAGTLGDYAAAVGALEVEATAVLDGSRALIDRSASIESGVDRQRPAVDKANGLFAAFAEGAGRVEAGKARLGALIATSSAEASTAADAAKGVAAGLADLGATLQATTKSLASVLAEVDGMLDTLGAIRSSNEFITSIAVNAAIIAAKSDRGAGDLRKVSQSIAAQAKRNTEHTEGLAKTVDEMRAAVLDHQTFLAATLAALERSAAGAGAAGSAMAGALPLLGEVSSGGERAALATAGLGSLVAEERKALAAITDKAETLSQAAETLRFGMDLERAVADILADVGVINRDVRDFAEGN
ncbi:MAG TPA: ABC transporter substrate-binding protein [Spirochaetales bacterium]|nr:ABC transporter substrate-binding protein [Spirochaetales bacterium]